MHHHIYTQPLRRSGLLTFFSSLVIQECLINFAGERLRSRMTSHCEIILGFCLSASHPVESGSKKQKRRPLPETSAERCTFLPAFRSSDSFLNAFSHTLYFSIKIFMVLFEKSTVRMAVFNGSEIIFFRIRSGIKAAKAFCVIIYTQIEFSPRLQKMVTSNTVIKICSHLSGLLYKKYP